MTTFVNMLYVIHYDVGGWSLSQSHILKEYYEIFSSSHLNRLLSLINIVPVTNLFEKYHMSKPYRTCVKMRRK